MSGNASRFPVALLAAYVVLSVVLALHPYDRATWWAENIPIWMIVAALVVTHRRFRFSNLAYLMMSVLVYLHTIGGHFTFERVPFGWITDAFGFERNHYDRVAHFSVGFYAFAIAEFLWVRRLSPSKWVVSLFAVFAIFTAAAVYEIIEWLYAAAADPEAGAAFLGSQGDIWDAQQDMLADGLGSIVAVLLFWGARSGPTAAGQQQPARSPGPGRP
jgi:putative membrane protein